MKVNRIIPIIALAVSGPLLAQSPAKLDGVATPEASDTATAANDPITSGSLTDTIRDSVTFSILTKALKASGLDLTLGQKATFTIFAPTDEAFGKLPDGTLDKLLLPENKEKLRSLLLYHVIPGKVMVANLKDGELKTMNGEKLEIDVDETEIEVGETKIFSSDVVATNGVMHSVGKVLVPESLDEFAGLED